MKKLLFTLMLAAACLATACSTTTTTGDNENTENTENVDSEGDAETTEDETFDGIAFLEEIRPNVVCLNDCELEMFLADVDFDKIYYGAYESEDAYANGDGPVAVLYQAGEEDQVTGYFLDPALCSYYPVKNFTTNAEVRENLRQYLADSVIDEKFHDDFLEYEGTLYLRRGSRGYGAVTLDLDSLAFLEERDGVYYVNVDYLIFDEYDYTATLAFQQTDGAWILTGITGAPE